MKGLISLILVSVFVLQGCSEEDMVESTSSSSDSVFESQSNELVTQTQPNTQSSTQSDSLPAPFEGLPTKQLPNPEQ
jgi:PBP1b-binding outer membrane lipoprotein LpoB